MDAYVIGGFRFALDVALKATLLLALTGVALLLLRRRSASTRHVVASLGLGAALLVPLFTSILPRVAVPLFPAPVAPASGPASVEKPAPLVGAVALAPAAQRPLRIESEVGPIEKNAPVPAGTSAAPAREGTVSKRLPSGIVLPVGGMVAVLVLWAAGTLALLARLAIGLARVRRCRRGAERVVSSDWNSLARSLGRSLALEHEVEIFFTPELPIAVTAGLRHPVLLLPASARTWDEGRRRIVLLHELAHVARRDWPALLLAQAAVAAYWFHPLGWILARRLRRDGERAADDRVLALGTKPSVYAGHLLGIIRSLKPAASRQALPVMGMARPSHFEERLRAILDPALLRRKMSAGQVRLTAISLLAFAGGIAALQPWSPQCAGAAALTVPESSAPHDRSTCPKTAHASGDAPDHPVARPAAAPAVARPREARADAVVKPSGHAADEMGGFVKASRPVADSGHADYRNARQLHEDGQYLEAARAFGRAYDAGYRRAVAAYNAACAWARAGKPDQAFEWLEKASAEGFRSSAHIGDDDDLASLRSDPRLPGLLQRLGRIELEAARRSPEGVAAAERFEELAKSSPDRGDEFYDSGRKLLRLGRYDLAERAFRLSARRGHRPGPSLYNAACALSLEGKRSEAMDLLQQALEAGFDDPKLIRTDEDLTAIRSEPKFRQLVDMADALELRADGKSFLELDRRRDRAAWQRAAERYEEYARAHPRLGRAWFNAGFAELAAGDAAAAARAFEKSIALDYRRPTSLYNLACSYARQGRKDEAFDALFRALDAGFDQAGTIADDDDLDSLHGDPRFQKVLRASRDGRRAAN